jgi:cytochrome c-type biogenesis protein
MSIATRLLELFLIGVATPLTAACVLPLYPAFVAYLASSSGADGDAGIDGGTDAGAGGPSPALLGVLVVAGVLSFVGLVGAVFTTVLQESLTGVVAVVSPVAFGVLALVGVALLFDLEVFSRLPTVEPPQSRYPTVSAFAYGFFFGAIVLPCNPGFVALFFARVPILFETRLAGLLGFLAFGLGIGAPLLAFALLSESLGRRATRTLARYSGPINRVTGAIVLGVSLYYLVYVFDVLGGVVG